mgnify:FL=1
MKNITVSIVSHNHGKLISNLLEQLSRFSKHLSKVVVTYNVLESLRIKTQDYPFEVCVIDNDKPKGFGANHNQAFELCSTEYFCVMNPDIFLDSDPFSQLLLCHEDQNISITAPLVLDLKGSIENSARKFPTFLTLVGKVLGVYNDMYKVDSNQSIVKPDWLAGMFLLIRSDAYSNLSGFDESFFLYYEDVDLCTRAWKNGFNIALCTNVFIKHDARRESHRNIKFLKWHIVSAIHYLVKYQGRLPLKTRG